MIWWGNGSFVILVYTVLFSLGSSALQRQVPFGSYDHSAYIEADAWNFYREPDPHSPSRWIFDTVNSFLKLWPNTRLRNGHSLVAGIIPVGTLLYHGTTTNQIPNQPQWTALEVEHSYILCGMEHPETLGCWHLTLAVTSPLRVLYFDGSSAAKMQGGSMDSQDLVAWGKIQPKRYFDEWDRILDLCAWAKDRNIHGFVRMEMAFEVMLCDFTANVKASSFLKIQDWRSDIPHRGISQAYRVVEAGKWHDRFPSEERIQLDYTRFISFYDTSLFPSLQAYRRDQERWDHRLKNVSQEDIANFHQTLDDTLKGEWGVSKSGINWSTLLTIIDQRYSERLDLLRYILASILSRSKGNSRDAMVQAHEHIRDMISHHILESAFPQTTMNLTIKSGPDPDIRWATPVYQECSLAHTQHLSVLSTLTRSETVLLQAVQDTLKEICRVLVGMWAEGVAVGLANSSLGTQLSLDDAQILDSALEDMGSNWKNRTEGLMNWLDWSRWSTCEPACGYEETCYLPTWPLFKHMPSRWPPPAPPSNRLRDALDREAYFALRDDESEDLPEPGPDDDWYHPSPKCIRRLKPFSFY